MPSAPVSVIPFFFNTQASTEIYTLSLHDALPISSVLVGLPVFAMAMWLGGIQPSRLMAVYVITFSLIASIVSLAVVARSEEHTSELQSQSNLVCRLLLEKKKKNTKKL